MIDTLSVVAELATGISTISLKNAIGKVFTKADEIDPDITEQVIDLKTRVNIIEHSANNGTIKLGEQVLEENQIAISLVDILKKSAKKKDELESLSHTSELQGVIKILFVTSNPGDTAKLRLKKEIESIEFELLKSKYRDLFTIYKKELASINDLSDGLLNHNPDFIHFTGHGTEKGIILHNQDDNSIVVNNKSLAQLFKLFSEQLACVFLNSCYSEQQAKIINRYVPNIIGMSSKVEDETAISFAQSFYKSLGAGKGLDFSFEFAKVNIGLNNLMGDSVPIFLTKSNNYAS